MNLQHAGIGIDWGAPNINLTVTNCTITGINPSVPGSEQYAVRLGSPVSVEHRAQ